MSTADYVARHMVGELNPAGLAVLIILATADRHGTGRVRMTAAQVAAERKRSVHWVREQMTALVRDGRHLTRSGWTYIIVGAAEHDVLYCGHPECALDALAVHSARRNDELAGRRRKLDAERKRIARQRAS